MSNSPFYFKKVIHSARGETMIGMLVSITLGATVLAAVASSFFQTSRMSKDQQMMLEAHEEAKAVADIMAFELRLIGAGVPFYQANFQIGGSGLGTAPLPIQLSSNASSISFFGNERGNIAILTSVFNPASSLTMAVNSSSGFTVGDTIYINDNPAGGANGLKGVIASKTSTSITINSSYIRSSGATFAIGSRVEPVRSITYSSPVDDSGITRDAEFGAINLTPRSHFTLQYKTSSGSAITLPLTNASVQNQLSAVSVTVNVTAPRPLANGEVYTAQAAHTVALRNLALSR